MVAKKENRLQYLDIAKGIGIIMVVWAHSRGIFSSYMYQFHMPLFFLISGFLYNDKATLSDYAKRKFLSLYVPFAFWNLSCCIAKRVLLEDVVGLDVFFKELIKIGLTLTKDGQFFGATWFLGTLFVISVGYKIVDLRVPEGKYKDWIMLAVFVAVSTVGFMVDLPYMSSRTLVVSLFFALGVWIKHNHKKIDRFYGLFTAVICALIFVRIGQYNKINMGLNIYKSPILFVIGACMASYVVIYVSRWIEKLPDRFLVKSGIITFGQHSMDIVIWQFVFFRPVIILQMLLNHDEINVWTILEHFPIYYSRNGWWIVYTIAGLVLPILWCSLLRSGVWGRYLKKLHIV